MTIGVIQLAALLQLMDSLAYVREAAHPRAANRQAALAQACVDLLPYLRGERVKDKRYHKLMARLPSTVKARK